MAEKYDVSPETEEEKKRKKKGFFFIFPIILLILAALIVVGFFATRTSSPWYDKQSQEGSYRGKSEEEIQADLNRRVDEGMMNISIASTIAFENGSTEGEARIENIASNTQDQKVIITLDDTNETVYESDAIAPDSYIQTIRLNRDLAPGTYSATATFTGYDKETHEKKGAAAAQIKLVVLA